MKKMKMKQKNKKVDFFLLLSILAASILGMLAGKGVVRGGDRVIWKGEGTLRVQSRLLIPPHLVINFEIQE